MVAIRATGSLTYIPVMTAILYDTFPGPPETFWRHGLISIFPSKEEMCPGGGSGGPGNLTGYPGKCD